jgi:hypothetical protein
LLLPLRTVGTGDRFADFPALHFLDPEGDRANVAFDAPFHVRRDHLQAEQLVHLVRRNFGLVAFEEALAYPWRKRLPHGAGDRRPRLEESSLRLGHADRHFFDPLDRRRPKGLLNLGLPAYPDL